VGSLEGEHDAAGGAGAAAPPSPLLDSDPQAIEELWNRLDPLAIDWRDARITEIVERIRRHRAYALEKEGARKEKRMQKQTQAPGQLMLGADEIAAMEW
jgi:hypothetical protein